jgi:hypothetical protein
MNELERLKAENLTLKERLRAQLGHDVTTEPLPTIEA